MFNFHPSEPLFKNKYKICDLGFFCTKPTICSSKIRPTCELNYHKNTLKKGYII